MKFTWTSSTGDAQQLFDDSETVHRAIARQCFPYSQQSKMEKAIKSGLRIMRIHNAKSVQFDGGTIKAGDHMNDCYGK